MKKTAIALSVLTSVAALTLSPSNARAEEPWREFEYHWKDGSGTPMNIKLRFSSDGRWEGDFNVESWPCDHGGGSCEVGAVIVVKAKDGRWLSWSPEGAAGANGLHIHKQGKDEAVKKHFSAYFDKDGKGNFTTQSDYRWKWSHSSDFLKDLLSDLKIAMKIGGEAISLLL